MPTIGIVAGEASGDLLGSHLIRALKAQRPDLRFVGIAGPKMQSEGAQSLFPMERLAVRGLFEVLRHLPGLLRLRKQLLRHFLDNPPDLFIGIDAPDFNFTLERKLKRKGIRTIHYVSPSIWAWRKGRLGKIKRAVSHMLALFPFEPALYEKVGIPVSYVGHPLADIIPLASQYQTSREQLRIRDGLAVIAMLPGSRQSEVEQLGDLYVKTAKKILQDQPNVQFLVPLITRETRDIFQQVIYANQAEHLPIKVMFGHAHLAMAAADAVIVAAGTATLEAALLKRPMVITYRMPRLSWIFLKRMNYLPYVGLPNILAGKFVVPELLQYEATPERIAETALKLISDRELVKDIEQQFTVLHQQLRQDTASKAAAAVLQYL
ncbi:lipid-A-disaccharide synthase [Pseudomethylobacillus aquaticus]|uniref:Lipid-A-disaccharide synthase n=1 Tax=Pseudomethylobacillus aquaticus TaxID=2676064 RepID=A0A3N0UXS1_9PROT|nr:lipid-A-disaccharide synthase [Pseudomethylobacillus aquaticus]ROH85285.1 lipid-A-disaccharide synthase [Pseudomethylobacillus aquaticus]